MKLTTQCILFFLAAAILTVACKKEDDVRIQNEPTSGRTIRFVLYTEQDFSNYHNIIHFTMSVKNESGQTIWDSLLPPMQVKDIPGFADRLIIEKALPGNDQSLLKAGFIYTIEHVGISWYWDSCPAGQTFKQVNFNFR